MIIITTGQKDNPEKIETNRSPRKINNLRIYNNENRNNLAGIHCKISNNTKIKYNGIIGMLDTGARANLVSYDTYEKFIKINEDMKVDSPPNRLIAANGEEIPVYKYLQITINIKGISIKTWVYVIKNLGYQLLLGIKFLREINAKWDFMNNKLLMMDPKSKGEGRETEVDIIKLTDKDNIINKIHNRPILFMSQVKKNKWIMPNSIQTLDLKLYGHKIKRNSYYIVEKILIDKDISTPPNICYLPDREGIIRIYIKNKGNRRILVRQENLEDIVLREVDGESGFVDVPQQKIYENKEKEIINQNQSRDENEKDINKQKPYEIKNKQNLQEDLQKKVSSPVVLHQRKEE